MPLSSKQEVKEFVLSSKHSNNKLITNLLNKAITTQGPENKIFQKFWMIYQLIIQTIY